MRLCFRHSISLLVRGFLSASEFRYFIYNKGGYSVDIVTQWVYNASVLSKRNQVIFTKKARLSPGTIVAVCSFVYFVSYFSRKDFAAAMAEMISEGVIDKQLGGYISMAMFILYGTGQLISGFLGDRVRPAHLLTFGLLTTALSNLLMAFLPAVAMVPLWAVNGLAQAMLWPPIVRILADNLEHERFVRANLLVTCAAHLSTVLLYLYVPLTITVASWRMTFYTASAIAFLAGALMIVLSAVTVLGNKLERKQTPTPVSNSDKKNDNNYLPNHAFERN